MVTTVRVNGNEANDWASIVAALQFWSGMSESGQVNSTSMGGGGLECTLYQIMLLISQNLEKCFNQDVFFNLFCRFLHNFHIFASLIFLMHALTKELSKCLMAHIYENVHIEKYVSTSFLIARKIHYQLHPRRGRAGYAAYR